MPTPHLKSAPIPAPAGNFISMLQGKSGGVTLDEIDYKLAEVVKAVQLTGKAGTLTYTVKIKRNKKHGVKILDDCKAKIPEEDSGEGYMYADEHGTLLKNNPQGPDLPGLVLVPAEPVSAPIAVQG